MEISEQHIVDAHSERQDLIARPSKANLTLAQLQDLVQRAIMDGDDTILSSIPGNGLTTSDVLLGVYQNAYTARLAEILAIDHPALETYMGADHFRSMALKYISAYPSTTPNVRWFARHLPSFLAETQPYKAEGLLSELAKIEKALADAFDASDDPVLTLEDLQAVPLEAWAELTFSAHSSVLRLTCGHGAYHRWLAHSADGELQSAPHETEKIEIIVWRSKDVARLRPLTTEEEMMWDEAMRGATFGRLCELLATFDDPDTAALRAAQFLQGWISAELIAKTTAK